MSLQDIVDDLLAATGASRVTLRQAVPGDVGASGVFPVTHEALGPGVGSLEGVATPNMAGQPVVLEVQQGRQVVQNDCRSAFPDDEPFQRMLELYGGMRAQIVTPVVRDGKTVAIISVHQLGRTREWADAEAARCREAAQSVLGLLPAGGGPA